MNLRRLWKNAQRRYAEESSVREIARTELRQNWQTAGSGMIRSVFIRIGSLSILPSPPCFRWGRICPFRELFTPWKNR